MYAHRQEFPQHRAALALVRGLIEGDEPWTLLWPCVYEFVRVVTHPRLLKPPSSLDTALAAVEALRASATVVLPVEGPRHPLWFERVLRDGKAAGNLAPAAHLVALMREHGVDAIFTADKDLRRFGGIRVLDPTAPGEGAD